jgi:hypothetical protein
MDNNTDGNAALGYFWPPCYPYYPPPVYTYEHFKAWLRERPCTTYQQLFACPHCGPRYCPHCGRQLTA